MSDPAVLSVHVEHLTTSVATLTKAIRELEEKVVGRREYDVEIASIKERLAVVESGIEDARKTQRDTPLRWVIPITVAVIAYLLPSVFRAIS